MKHLFSVVVFFLAMVGAAGSQVTPPAPDVQTIGPRVGARVPTFTLSDQNGMPRSLESLLGPKGAILVFFRSADW